MNPLTLIDKLLNRFTMYRVILYLLIFELAFGVILSYARVLSFSGTGILATTALLIAVCWATNKLLSVLYKAPSNTESWLITALILALIMPQTTTIAKAVGVGLAGVLAIASKFILAYKNRHIFNPAAFGAVAVGLFGLGYATWWVGNPVMTGVTVILGLAVTRKLRRLDLLSTYGPAALLVTVIWSLVHGQPVVGTLRDTLLSSPFFFLGAAMLTEPATMPNKPVYRFNFALIVGVLSAARISYGSLDLTAELALLIGNLFAFFVEFRPRTVLSLVRKTQLSPVVYDFIFSVQEPLRYQAGQYMEWTLPHQKVDSRGNRRTFTIASAPHEPEIHLGIRYDEKGSSFKRTLMGMKPNDTLVAGRVTGDFTQPRTAAAKQVWIAGGVGITPFRSMAAELTATKSKADIDLYYLVRTDAELAYREIFDAAASNGLKTHYLAGTPLTIEMLRADLGDLTGRTFYLAGSDGMVRAYKKLLRAHGVKPKQIITDYFAGY